MHLKGDKLLLPKQQYFLSENANPMVEHNEAKLSSETNGGMKPIYKGLRRANKTIGPSHMSSCSEGNAI